jgi:hypothetical protein
MRVGVRRPLTAAQQFLNLRTNPVCVGNGRLRSGRLVWRYRTTPTPLSRIYVIRIEFQQGDTPDIFVEDPDLTSLAEGRRLPHVYGQKPTRLCLYLPRTREWEAWMRLDQTVVPWTSLWLFYFEEWLVSDDWKGGGQHPKGADQERRSGRCSSTVGTSPISGFTCADVCDSPGLDQ